MYRHVVRSITACTYVNVKNKGREGMKTEH